MHLFPGALPSTQLKLMFGSMPVLLVPFDRQLKRARSGNRKGPSRHEMSITQFRFCGCCVGDLEALLAELPCGPGGHGLSNSSQGESALAFRQYYHAPLQELRCEMEYVRLYPVHRRLKILTERPGDVAERSFPIYMTEDGRAGSIENQVFPLRRSHNDEFVTAFADDDAGRRLNPTIQSEHQ